MEKQKCPILRPFPPHTSKKPKNVGFGRGYNLGYNLNSPGTCERILRGVWGLHRKRERQAGGAHRAVSRSTNRASVRAFVRWRTCCACTPLLMRMTIQMCGHTACCHRGNAIMDRISPYFGELGSHLAPHPNRLPCLPTLATLAIGYIG